MAVDRQQVTLPSTIPAPAQAGSPLRQASLWRDALQRYARNRAAVGSAVLFAVIVLFCIVTPIVTTRLLGVDPNKVDFSQAYAPVSWEHPLGTDKFGRDLLTRTALGGRISLGIGFAAAAVILLVGIAYGALSGFAGGKIDNAMMRFLDALYGLPYLPFAIITIALIGSVNFLTMVIALSIASWLTTARLVRGQVITLKQNDYVRAAHAVGARWYQILGRHLLPNTLGVLVIALFLDLPGVVLGEAFLSFIGLGINPPDASWGAMAQDGRSAYVLHPAIIAIPSLAIAALVLCSNFIADGLRDALDPRTRET